MLRDEYFRRVYHDECLAWYAQREVGTVRPRSLSSRASVAQLVRARDC